MSACKHCEAGEPHCHFVITIQPVRRGSFPGPAMMAEGHMLEDTLEACRDAQAGAEKLWCKRYPRISCKDGFVTVFYKTWRH